MLLSHPAQGNGSGRKFVIRDEYCRTTIPPEGRTAMQERFAALAALVLLVAPAGQAGVTSGAPAQQSCRTFPETGKQVCGTFLNYWNTHGGLAQQGFPISNEMKEKSDTDGKVYTVQYFERAVFEAHPENKPPFDVLLSLLGNFYYMQKYPNGAPGQVANTGPGSVQFKETGKHLGGVFLTYWNSHGGLAQQGIPISEEFNEKSDLDGKTYKVQYFERAVFEYHPENRPPYDVLLSQLGTFRYKARYSQTLAQGTWAGSNMAMTVTAAGVQFEFGCAHGSVDGTVPVDSSGAFSATGVYVMEHPIEPAQGDTADTHPAVYSGTTDGKTTTLIVVVTDSGTKLGPFTLTLGAQAKVVKCQ